MKSCALLRFKFSFPRFFGSFVGVEVDSDRDERGCEAFDESNYLGDVD